MESSKGESPLDEIQWSSPQWVALNGGIHANSILFYFSESPFFDRTSNNAVVYSQALGNYSQQHIFATRTAFEARLREMSGLEYIVAQEPAESGPGVGTGVWVIRKQTRRKGKTDFIGGVEVPAQDDIEVHADFFVVGENIYTAPAFTDILNARIVTISSAISKIFPAVDQIQKWTPATGRRYKTVAATAPNPLRPRGMLESKEPTPMPEVIGSTGSVANGGKPKTNDRAAAAAPLGAPDSRLAEESFAIHTRYGGEYMDENPITGKPGDFHLSSTGRKDKPTQLSAGPVAAGMGLPMLKTLADNSPLSRDGKAEKPGRTGAGGPPKPRRRKSKGGTTPS